MKTLKPSSPTHLSIFVTDPDTGRPVARLPLYAEVAVPRIAPPLHLDERLREAIHAAIMGVDSGVSDAERERVEHIGLQALAQTIDKASRDQSATELEQMTELWERILHEALAAAERDRLADVPSAELLASLVSLLKLLAPEAGLSLSPEIEETGIVWADPLGVLTTDHMGYASFDLKRLRPEVQVMLGEAIKARREDPDAVANLAIWIQLYGHAERFDAFRQARFAFDAVVARLSTTWNTLPSALINMGPRALQNPSLTDWRLSPASFAASPKSLVGEDGCEELVPANVALQEFVLRQVVRVTDLPDGVTLPDGYRFAYVDDYKVSWFSLGHSLGEILYSLPLAPGESVKLAVIDWSWDSLTRRDETTKLTEELLHQTHRDRTISETVKAGLRELQHGSSFMGGAAGASGGSGGANLGVVGLGAAVGNTWSLGGSTASSIGSRELAAENVQRLSDSFSQASSAQRELNSTVVIQARQEESQSIQTRTFTNYNHSHTLTILYYEVLRHFRVTTEWVRRRHAILARVPARIARFDERTLIRHRYQLEPALLDLSLKPAFDLLEKQETIRGYQKLNNITPSDDWVQPDWEGEVDFHMFELGIKTTKGEAETASTVVAYVITTEQGLAEKKFELRYVYKGGHMGEGQNQVHNLNSGKRFDSPDAASGVWTFVKPFHVETGEFVTVKWKDIVGFQFEKWGSDGWRIDFLQINAFGPDGLFVPLTTPEVLRDVDLVFEPNEPSSQAFTWFNRPRPRPALMPPANRSPEKTLTMEEHQQVQKLIDHIEHHRDYYNRVVLLATDPNAIAVQFETEPWTPGKTLEDAVQPYPLEVFGSYVAYPLATQPTTDDTFAVDIAAALNGNDPARRQWAEDKLDALDELEREKTLERVTLASARSERLITLPTRGVFAEGKLGHCNVSEEIDNTRFWKWEEHPIPFEAPGIQPVTPIQPQPQQISATPTAFPQSLVNFVNPSSAPDPTGLAAALSLLGTPNIFRDMSGRQEVADLLEKLSDNSISIAEAANRAREIQAKYGVDLDRKEREQSRGNTAMPTGGAHTPDPIPSAQSAAQRESAEIDNARKAGETAIAVLPPAKRKPVENRIANTLSKTRVVWQVVLTSEWSGQGIVQAPMPGTYSGYLRSGALVDQFAPLGEQFSSAEVIWTDVALEGVPQVLHIEVDNPASPDGALEVVVPPLVVGDLTLSARSYSVPLRAAPNLPTKLVHTLNGFKADPKSPVLNFHGVGAIERKEIKITSKVNAGGELLGEFGKEFEKEATIEIVKLAIKSTLKAAVKVNVGGEVGIEGTYEILFVKGYDVKPAVLS